MQCVVLSSLTSCAVERERNGIIQSSFRFHRPHQRKPTKTNTDQNTKENIEESVYGLIPVPKTLLKWIENYFKDAFILVMSSVRLEIFLSFSKLKTTRHSLLPFGSKRNVQNKLSKENYRFRKKIILSNSYPCQICMETRKQTRHVLNIRVFTRRVEAQTQQDHKHNNSSEEIINLSRPSSVANWKLQVKQSGRYVMSDLQVSCCKISWCV